MNQDTAVKILDALTTHAGPAAPELRYSTPYQLSVAVILSAQTTDRQVNGVTPDLFGKYPDFASLSRARISDVMKIVRSTGFYKTKARHVVAMARMVMADFGGTLPPDREQLMKLPGVGRKSANVILAMGFGIEAIAVDTHIGRVARRIGFSDSMDPTKVEHALLDAIPRPRWIESHHLLIRHGRTVCHARKPLCGECPISAFCRSSGKIH